MLQLRIFIYLKVYDIANYTFKLKIKSHKKSYLSYLKSADSEVTKSFKEARARVHRIPKLLNNPKYRYLNKHLYVLRKGEDNLFTRKPHKIRNIPSYKLNQHNEDTVKIGFNEKHLNKIRKFLLKNKRQVIIFRVISKKRLCNNRMFPWINKMFKLWSVNKNLYNTTTYMTKTHSGFRSLNHLYKRSLRRYLKFVKIKFKKRNKTRSFSRKFSLFKNKPLRFKLYNWTSRPKRSYKGETWTKKYLRRVKIKSKKKILRPSLYNKLFSKLPFKKRLFRSKRLKSALFKKKVYSAVKSAKRLYRKVLCIRSKGKNRLIGSVRSLNHKSLYDKLMYFEMTLISLILKTPFVKSINDAMFLINSGLIFVNGMHIANHLYSLPTNSRLQMPVSVSSYKWVRLKDISMGKGYKKANRLKWYKRRVRSSRFKKISRKFPKWLYNYSIVGVKPPIAFEIDLNSMSAILLYKPFRLNEISTALWHYINFNAHSVYLWKTIN